VRHRTREREKFIIRQPPLGEKDDYDSENSWISDGLVQTSVGNATINTITIFAVAAFILQGEKRGDVNIIVVHNHISLGSNLYSKKKWGVCV